MVYVNNSVGLTMDQSSVCEWDRHKMELNKQEQRSYIKIAVLSPCDYDLFLFVFLFLCIHSISIILDFTVFVVHVY